MISTKQRSIVSAVCMRESSCSATNTPTPRTIATDSAGGTSASDSNSGASAPRNTT